MQSPRTFIEFFAGGGMARLGLGQHWSCVFANDFDEMKAATYAANWGRDHLKCADVATLKASDLPTADLAWASFPCQDLSLAGAQKGLGRSTAKTATRSGTFWSFWQLMKGLEKERRAPRIIVLENVYGALSSHGGKDFAAVASALSSAGYRFGALVVDAKLFVPQSRQRVFWIAVRKDVYIPEILQTPRPTDQWHPKALRAAHDGISKSAQRKWIWWQMAPPQARTTVFSDLVEDNPTSVKWHTAAETKRLLGLMSDVNLAKVREAKRVGRRMVGGVYRRTRPYGNGAKTQRAEVRFDDVAGCLRTPAGGSSRQTILVVEGRRVRSRLMSSREAARLMGLPDQYQLPARYNDAYHVAGDGVVVPVVQHLSDQILLPIIDAHLPMMLTAAE